MSPEPTCPSCATVVQPNWDWCHACGFDPEGLRPQAVVSTADAGAPAEGAAPVGGVPPGWYPDPGGQPLTRWWDGSSWTEHLQPPPPAVHPPQVHPPQPQPLAAAPKPAPIIDVTAEGNLLDVEINQGPVTKKRLVVTRDGLVLGKTVVDFAQVTGLAFWVTKQSLNGIPTATDRRVVLVTPGRTEKISVGQASTQRRATKDRQAEVFEALVSICERTAGVRICDTMFTRVRTGHAVTVGIVQFDVHGFSVPKLRRRTSCTWGQYAGARLRAGSVELFVEGNGQPERVGAVSMQTINAVLLPAVMDRCAAEFGG